MGVTKIWDIKVSLHKALHYVTDPNKTVLQDDTASIGAVSAAIQYAANGNKTQSRRYVTAMNCNTTYAEKQFANVKARFDKRNGTGADPACVCGRRQQYRDRVPLPGRIQRTLYISGREEN